MWIFDSYYKGCVELWGRERRSTKVGAAYPPSFYMHLQDPSAHREMIEALKTASKQKSVASGPSLAPSRATGSMQAGRWPEKIEIQIHHQAELYNVDVRQDQRYMAEHDIFPCGDRDESRFSLDFEVPLTRLVIQVAGDPSMPREISRVELCKQDQCR
jgi:DNA polymerase I